MGGVAFADEDILRFDVDSGQWSLYLDGSDIGLSKRDIDALHLLDDGSLLLSLEAATTLGELEVDDSDVLRFVPTSLGSQTAGALSLIHI